jgi:iron complex transport system ATP-binding protein
MTLALQNASLALGGKPVLSDIALALKRGEVTVLMGPNGAGKTSLIRLLAGLFGRNGPAIDGAALSSLDPLERARRIGYLPQNAVPAWNVVARELVMLGRLPHRGRFAYPSTADGQAVAEALAITDTAHLAERPFEAMSGGERARVLLARVLAGTPDWLLADEPMASLDPAHQLDIVALLRAEAGRGTGVVTVLHDLTLAARLADRIILLHQGRIVADGPPETTLTPALLAQVYGIEAAISRNAEGRMIITPLARRA